MRGAWRFAIVALTAGLWLAPPAARAQDATPPASSAPADAVGPRELQNFSLSGTVTRQADQPAPARAAPPSSAARDTASASPTPVRARRTETADARRETVQKEAPPRAATNPPAQLQQVTTAPPSLPTVVSPPSAPVAAAPAASDAATPPPALVPQRGISLLPWLIAALALGAGGAFLFWRNRSRPALAGGPELNLFKSPQSEPARAAPPALRPAPAPQPRVSPPPAPAPTPPAPVGIVSTNLRAWIDVAMQPLRCIVTDEGVTFEFELDLFNSGSAPARDIHIAAVLINAGATQDQQLENFFAQEAGPGERISIIEPLKRVTFTTQIATPLDRIQVLEMGGRQVFVPLLAFNATYRQGRKGGRTSVSYLVGRNGDGEKLAPFRLDLGARVFRSLGARQLPQGVRN